ncbi:damage-control phosphatase ARMT1 family protein [Thiomicrorhabdus sp.]|uniref:damage-control phosphatase ARMT1 family protein n=1 Tax=Thiomicrorhabdus sp. TaxID=2039724 RepID=UPI0029C69E51|nr:ARMT1-like domain-containing protein [Thiomicrorhabdus sp.]
MKSQPECFSCLYGQALKTSRLLNLPDEQCKAVLDRAAQILQAHTLDSTAPQIAKEIYQAISDVTGIDDPVEEAKQIAIRQVQMIDTSQITSLNDALKLSVIGNVIDFGAPNQFNLQATVESHFKEPFARNDIKKLEADLQSASSLVLIGDNVGEHIFDLHLLKVIKQQYPHLKLSFFVRGKPVINDVTIKEADIFTGTAEVIDSGVATPGYDLSEVNERSFEIFKEADIVLAKGMGNFESLFQQTPRDVYYLFIVKCQVIANAINQSVKDMILWKEEID